ncbi:TetR/AcrR family transcriptional regulator [Rhizobium sp. ZPR3]|uniref:TetR/AcrR family transcriptional regulator n=2 Tax=unclassified Rhizobium TaxID=2613769 RepID=A0AAU7SPC0_9HYPH
MRYPPDQKAKARAAMVAAGAKALRQKGFNGIGVDGLASAAGVTSGAFYSNFANKEALLKDIIGTCLGEPFVTAEGTVLERREKLKEWLALYFSVGHRDNPETGCVMPTLSADVARANKDVRVTYTGRIKVLVTKIAEVLEGETNDRERKAWNIIALMIGSVSTARAMSDQECAEAVLNFGLVSAMAQIGEPNRSRL